MICVLFCLPFRHLFRDAAFFFRGIRVSEIHFRELSRKNPEKNPLCSLANTYWNTCSPPAVWESLDFIRAPCRPSPLLLLLLHLVLHPTLNRQLQISVGTAGPQPRAPDLVLHPTLNRQLQISVGTAGPQPRAPDLGPNCDERQISVGTATPLSNRGGHPS